MEESDGLLPEKYSGEEIEEIKITGGSEVFQEVVIMFKDHTLITLRAEIDVSKHFIVPRIIAERRKWFRLSSDNSPQPIMEEVLGGQNNGTNSS